ncbi:GNAT family N-acetyltransferase [Paenibacillus sp. GCM10027626]|uniref:GNAT family N-acetyltransferase n=1 Tax=Paenibacillus sp. GCM10027626 TaxID=3273411 RepID=UPI00362A5A3C
MSELSIRICSHVDLALLATLNKQLIEDERHDNTMNIEQLKERMRSFIDTDYKAYIFGRDCEIIGYALVDHTRHPLYLRHFFVCRNFRRNGYGKLAFEKLIERLNTKEIDIEVMHWNHIGYEFWKSLGFIERSIYMRLEGGND